MARDPNILDLVEACYRIDAPEAEWVGGLADAARAHFPGSLGTAAFTFRRLAGEALTVGEIQLSPRVDPAWLRGFLAALPCQFLDEHRVGTRYRASSSAAFDAMKTPLSAFGGATDVVSLVGRDPSGHGVWIGAPVTTVRARRAADADLHRRVAAHLVAAYRFRRKLARARRIDDAVEAVVSPTGAIEHVEGRAATRAAREAIRRAARTLDEVRGAKRRRDPESSVRVWRPLVDARWSLVDRFDTDGRRFVVAAANAPDAPPSARLSERERQVLAFAVLGHHNKLIAYELGLSASTVRVLLHRAARKLGVSTRADAIARFARPDTHPGLREPA